MTVDELCNLLDGKIIAGENAKNNNVCGGYTCDFLSFVIGKAKENDAWITVIGNQNTIAVASLADVACIVLAESSPLDKDAKEKADANDIPVILCEDTAFNLSVKLGKLLNL